MDLEKTGKFIAELRKNQELTQEQLGEKLGVTNKTVSRWETGVYLPPADILVQMSEMFSVSINEILAGKRLDETEYRAAAEENLKEVIGAGSFDLKDRITFYKQKWLKEHIAFMVSMGIVIIAVLVAGIVLHDSLFTGCSVLLLAIFHGIRNNRMMAYVERNAYDGKGNHYEERDIACRGGKYVT